MWERGGHLQREHWLKWGPEERQMGILGHVGRASLGSCPASLPCTKHRWARRGCTEDPRGEPQRRRLAGAVCWDRNSKGSTRSGVGCQGWEFRGRRGRATEVVPCQEPQRLPTSSHPGHRAWLGSIFTHTLSFSSLSAPGSCLRLSSLVHPQAGLGAS